jgi:uncharacterized protein (TIGR03663 family)
MKPALLIALWISVIVAGVCLRFEDLAKRPFHADEATGARITARRMESGGGQFDPKHYHGPLLADLAIPMCRLRGESRWQDLTKSTLRWLPAVAGTLIVMLPLWGRRRWGDGPMLLAAAFLATSPLLVYYSRMFIHESLLVLFGMAALFALTRKPAWAIPGIFIGLMFATKESFAISIIAWTGAALLVAFENRQVINRELLACWWRQYRLPAAISLLAAALAAMGIYTDGFRHPQGAVDALRTFFVYETVAGHDKPWTYYFQLLALPKKSGGLWWFETPVLVFALWAYASTFRRHPEILQTRPAIRFIAYAAAAHFLIYSLIAYKTPWLACLPWAHVCLLAGFAVNGFSTLRLPIKADLAVIAAACLFIQFRQARLASGRYAADVRNPYAYVPTRNDIETLALWLDQLVKVAPAGGLQPIAVIGADYWPLPWYLRKFDQIGYWQNPPADLAQLPLVFSMPDSLEPVMNALETSHHGPLPRGLRAEVPIYLFVRKDLWQRWLESDNP